MDIAVCDDNNIFNDILYGMLLNVEHEVEENFNIDVYTSGEKLIERIRQKGGYDIIFLDIQFPETSGIEIGRLIREKDRNLLTHIVFVSSETSYAMQLFDLKPDNFLVKPLTQEKVSAVCKGIIEQLDNGKRIYSYVSGRTRYYVPFNDILYFENSKRKIIIHTVNETREFYSNLDEVMQHINSNRFIQIHKSYVVNYENISNISGTDVVMNNGDMLPLSRARRDEVLKILMRLEGEAYGGVKKEPTDC